MFTLMEQTNVCNLHCKSCPTRLNLRPKGYMSFETFKNIIDQQLEHRTDYRYERVVMHGYGEPLLNPDLFKNLDYLDLLGFKQVDFSDNCMLMTQEIIDKLCTYKCLNYIKLSLNSSRKELMEEINAGSDFDKVVKNIRMVCDTVSAHGFPFKIQVQLMHTAKNMDETKEDIYNLIQRKNFDVLECKVMSMLSMDNTNDLLIKGYQFWDGDCIFAQTSFMFQWDGDMVGCCVDNTKSQVIGNYKDGIYSEKIQERIKKLREELKINKYDNLPACLKCEGKRK